MKILFFMNPKGLMERDLVSTMRKRGIEVFEETCNFGFTPEGHSMEMFSPERLFGILDSFRPDMVFSFNANGLDDQGVISGEYAQRGIPFVTWFVDRPRIADIGQKYVKPNSHVFSFDSVYIPTLKGAGFEHVYHLPLATNPDRFRPMENIRKEEAVCFIGDLDYKTIQYLARNMDTMISGADEKFYASVEAAIEEQLCHAGRDTWEIIEGALKGNGFRTDYPQMIKDIFDGFVEREASLRLRMEAVRVVSERFPVVVFGDELWGDVVGSGYRGRVSYFTDEIVETYNRYAVHVNISKFQLKKAINQRPYDVPACGGFLITDRRDDLHKVFSGDEMVSFGTIEELVEEVVRFFNNEGLRKDYTEKARARVLSGHTYDQRIDIILEKVVGPKT
jgi:spore maturation protein CgeB